MTQDEDINTSSNYWWQATEDATYKPVTRITLEIAFRTISNAYGTKISIDDLINICVMIRQSQTPNELVKKLKGGSNGPGNDA